MAIVPKVRLVGLDIVRAKLGLAPLHIAENNLLMVEAMLDWVKAETEAATPLGPGHFGYHLRDMFKTETRLTEFRTIGELKSPITGYWREFGTRGRFRKSSLLTKGAGRRSRLLELFGGQGERAFMTAHKALTGARRIIKVFYGGRALWWRL